MARHRLTLPKEGPVTAVRERLERRLDVETEARYEEYQWAIYFDAPSDVNLDFLRPDILPPNEHTTIPFASGEPT